ncbi:MAG: hypothetical protein JWO44_1003 [Bacteroidetes bacterium]|nr:hypothetical protein [Bacteroidota bacterium]
MKKKFNLFTILLFSITIIFQTHAQSSSVFDANYFNHDNTAPPIKIGKGFHINDVYKQTKSCFTAASSNPSKLTSQQTGGKKTSIRLFYTRTNEEYNKFKSKGISGKVSFLNLFSSSGQKLEEYTTKDIQNEEKIIFYADVDFGVYSFETDPQLTPDAKALIDQNKIQDFIKFYGTHYISGIRKESDISVILTKTSSKTDNTEETSSSIGIEGKIPFRGSGSMEIDNGNWTNEQLSKYNFSVSVEINGPGIEQSSIQNQITAIINGNGQEKASAIAAIIESAVKNISDPNQSYITQYYYSPFTLYGIDGINWDEKKQNLLSKINEAVISVYSAKTLINELISESGKEQLQNGLTGEGLPQNYTDRIMAKYNEIIPTLNLLNAKADEYMKELETKYTACADVNCITNSTCCNNENYLTEITSYNLTKKINDEVLKIYAVAEDVVAEMSIPECEKKQKGIITIKNLSANPYTLYQGDKYLETLAGHTEISYNVNKGTYNFKAVQNSGYLMYPTENNRQATITKTCQEIVLKIGFED